MFTQGQRIIVAHGARQFDGVIELVSQNGVSLAVTFDGMIGPWLGGAALLWRTDHYETLDGLKVEVYPAMDES